MKKRTGAISVVLLVVLFTVGTALVVRLSTQVQDLEERLADVAPHSPAPAPTNTSVEAGAIDVPNIDPPAVHLRETITKVDRALAALARAQQRRMDRTGHFTVDMYKLSRGDRLPEDVIVLETITEPTGFCIEMAHFEMKGTRRRFISVSGQIDSGTCDAQRPLSEQVGDDPAAESGGRYVISDVRLAERGVPPQHSSLGNK